MERPTSAAEVFPAGHAWRAHHAGVDGSWRPRSTFPGVTIFEILATCGEPGRTAQAQAYPAVCHGPVLIGLGRVSCNESCNQVGLDHVVQAKARGLDRSNTDRDRDPRSFRDRDLRSFTGNRRHRCSFTGDRAFLPSET